MGRELTDRVCSLLCACACACALVVILFVLQMVGVGALFLVQGRVPPWRERASKGKSHATEGEADVGSRCGAHKRAFVSYPSLHPTR